MHRIQRLLGVHTPTGPRAGPGGWMAPLAIALAVATALSAMAMARPGEIEKKRPHFEAPLQPIDQVDLVSILREQQANEAELFAVLREAGLDNETLMTFLDSLGTEPRVRRAIELAFKEAHFVESRLHEARDYVAGELAADRITKEQARKHLEGVRLKLHEHFKAKVARHREGAAFVEQRMRRLRKQVEDELAAGLITEDQAEKRLGRARAEFKAMLAERVENRSKLGQRLESHLHKIHKEIKADLAAGLITEKEAKQRLHRAKEDLHARLFAQLETDHPDIADRLRALHQKIEDQLAAGLITQPEAQDRLRRAKLELHEHLMSKRGTRWPVEELIELRMHEVLDRVKADLAAGRITEAEAKRLLAAAKQELHESFQDRLHQHHRRLEDVKRRQRLEQE